MLIVVHYLQTPSAEKYPLPHKVHAAVPVQVWQLLPQAIQVLFAGKNEPEHAVQAGVELQAVQLT